MLSLLLASALSAPASELVGHDREGKPIFSEDVVYTNLNGNPVYRDRRGRLVSGVAVRVDFYAPRVHVTYDYTPLPSRVARAPRPIQYAPSSYVPSPSPEAIERFNRDAERGRRFLEQDQRQMDQWQMQDQLRRIEQQNQDIQNRLQYPRIYR